MTKHSLPILALISLLVGVFYGFSRYDVSLRGYESPPILQNITPTSGTPEPSDAHVVLDGPTYAIHRVIDGDTVVAIINDTKTTIRLIGLNTPESVDPRRPVECFGKEASEKASSVLEGEYVRVALDPTQGTYDKYGRLLAYIFLKDGTLFNKLMIAEGYGHEYTYRTPYAYQDSFREAELSARSLKKGLWADDACIEAFTFSPAVPNDPDKAKYITDNTECRFNTYDCADFLNHTEAQAVYEYCGGKDHDIHWLDQDQDTIACESLRDERPR